MPFLLDVEEARKKITAMHMERATDGIDAEIVQDNVECANLEEEIHPDYETQHPDFYAEKSKEPKKTSNSSYQKITLIDKKEIRRELQKLDPDQRYVVDVLIRFARFLKLAKKGRCQFPTPPLMVIEGDAGSGKSEVIRILCQVMEHEFREAGDDPDKPYILKGAFTGEAATNIKGQTLHTLFHLNFGNRLFKLSDNMRDEMKDQLQNLRLIIIDEYSMLSADTL